MLFESFANKNNHPVKRGYFKIRPFLIKKSLMGKCGRKKLLIRYRYPSISRQVNEAQQETFYEKSFRYFPVDKNRLPEMRPRRSI